MENKSFFDKKLLQSGIADVKLSNIETAVSLDEILKKYATDKYFAIAYYFNKVYFGYCEAGKMLFAEDSIPAEKFLLSVRLFNEDEEIFINHDEGQYSGHVIRDNVENGEKIEFVDTVSNLFGSRVKKDMPEGFITLVDPGRKIEMTIPAETKAEHYALATRSYIVCDKQTGQAGYGFYRMLSIRASE